MKVDLATLLSKSRRAYTQKHRQTIPTPWSKYSKLTARTVNKVVRATVVWLERKDSSRPAARVARIAQQHLTHLSHSGGKKQGEPNNHHNINKHNYGSSYLKKL